MRNKLIIVEGLPGSEKSTTAKTLYDVLRQKGLNAKLYIEGDKNLSITKESIALII